MNSSASKVGLIEALHRDKLFPSLNDIDTVNIARVAATSAPRLPKTSATARSNDVQGERRVAVEWSLDKLFPSLNDVDIINSARVVAALAPPLPKNFAMARSDDVQGERRVAIELRGGGT